MADEVETHEDIMNVAVNSSASAWNPETLYKVHCFKTASATEKQNVFETLIVDLSNAHDIQKKQSAEISDLKSKLNDQSENVSKINKLMLDLDAQTYANQVCVQEKVKFETQFLQLKKIVESWCKSTERVNQCINDQIPKQAKAVLGGDYEHAASLADSTKVDPVFEPKGNFSKDVFSPISIFSEPKPNYFTKSILVTEVSDMTNGNDEEKVLNTVKSPYLLIKTITDDHKIISNSSDTASVADNSSISDLKSKMQGVKITKKSCSIVSDQQLNSKKVKQPKVFNKKCYKCGGRQHLSSECSTIPISNNQVDSEHSDTVYAKQWKPNPRLGHYKPIPGWIR